MCALYIANYTTLRAKCQAYNIARNCAPTRSHKNFKKICFLTVNKSLRNFIGSKACKSLLVNFIYSFLGIQSNFCSVFHIKVNLFYYFKTKNCCFYSVFTQLCNMHKDQMNFSTIVFSLFFRILAFLAKKRGIPSLKQDSYIEYIHTHTRVESSKSKYNSAEKHPALRVVCNGRLTGSGLYCIDSAKQHFTVRKQSCSSPDKRCGISNFYKNIERILRLN